MEFRSLAPAAEWRGPVSYNYADVPVETGEDIKDVAKGMEYWGQVPDVQRRNLG